MHTCSTILQSAALKSANKQYRSKSDTARYATVTNSQKTKLSSCFSAPVLLVVSCIPFMFVNSPLSELPKSNNRLGRNTQIVHTKSCLISNPVKSLLRRHLALATVCFMKRCTDNDLRVPWPRNGESEPYKHSHSYSHTIIQRP